MNFFSKFESTLSFRVTLIAPPPKGRCVWGLEWLTTSTSLVPGGQFLPISFVTIQFREPKQCSEMVHFGSKCMPLFILAFFLMGLMAHLYEILF